MVTIKLYLDTRRPKKDGTAPLRLSLCLRRRVNYIGLGVSLPAEMWDAASGRVSQRHPLCRRLNNLVQRALLDAESAVLDLEATGKQLTLSDYTAAVRAAVLGAESEQRETFAQRLVAFASSGGKKESTRQLYLFTLSRMRTYDPAVDELTFEQIDRRWLEGFDSWLAENGGRSQNYRNIHLRNIRAVFNAALDDEVTAAYPFRRLQIRPVATPKRSLSVERLRELFACDVEPYAVRYVDLFKLIFCLCGINAVDLYSLRCITDGRIEYLRAKTGRPYSIKVEPEAMEIIERYRGRSALLDIADHYADHRDFIKHMNRALQRIGTVSRSGRGGKKAVTAAFPGLTTYWARHSWATIARSIGVSRDDIRLALGHGAQTVTDIYIDEDIRRVDEANRRVLDWVFYGKK